MEVKKGLVALIVMTVVWVNTLGTTVTWSGEGDEIDLRYMAQNGYVELTATAPGYTYTFQLSASLLKGFFSGTATGFLHDFAYLEGCHISYISSSGVEIQVGSRAQAARIIEKLNTIGGGSLKVRIILRGDKVILRVEKPKEPIFLPPRPIIKAYYVYDDKKEKIGGYFENIGNAPFKGRVEYRAGLSYDQGWIAESMTNFAFGRSNITITIPPKGKVNFVVTRNPMGGWTFVFPELIYNGSPMSFSVFPPSPDHKSVGWFKEMIEKWWTGYHDPEPQVDYVNVKIRLKGEDEWLLLDVPSLYFFMPIVPYFMPPR